MKTRMVKDGWTAELFRLRAKQSAGGPWTPEDAFWLARAERKIAATYGPTASPILRLLGSFPPFERPGYGRFFGALMATAALGTSLPPGWR